MRLPMLVACVGFALSACPPATPPPVPPGPTNPTNTFAVALQPADVIDASILSDGGGAHDGTVFELDAGAHVR